MATSSRDRVLRVDAQRNQDRIVAAAHEAFAELGYEVTIEEIARRAGVGAATIYRRFPTKERLLHAIFETRIGELELAVAAAAAMPDPWEALLAGIRALVEIQTANMVFLQALDQAGAMLELKDDIRDRVFKPLCSLFSRAQASGQIRRDLAPSELPLLIQMVTATAKHSPSCAAPSSAERYLALLTDALRTPTPSPLPPA
ncbi:MAG TPA: helix-turn-helix domain-containing protein [Solirubrobacteraceae bacterium]|jgi:AcrR family transcriptional regulator|nr:helix-turn-helix domain-containing protein [Solirubrobacteraceae bacterium]